MANGFAGTQPVLPRGGQRSTVEVRFIGDRLGDVREVLFYSPGFSVKKIEPVPKNPKEARATIAIAADCALGEHKLRLVTATGVSPLQTFWVSQFPNATEEEPNNDFATPQHVPLNTTVEGTVQNEDVDYYRVTAKKGQVLSAEIEAIRLSNTLFDPYIAILDAKRFELDAADDTPLLLQDCFASIIAPADGDYWIEVRDSSYGGGGSSRYRLHIGQFPRPSAIFPAGGQAGADTEVRFIGAKGELPKQTVPTPAKPDANFGILAKASFSAPSANPSASPLPERLERIERKPEHRSCPGGNIATSVQRHHRQGRRCRLVCVQRQRPTDPRACLRGRSAAAGQRAQRVRAGRQKHSGQRRQRRQRRQPRNGDTAGRWQTFHPLHHHLRKGGADYVYRVEATPIAPKLATFIPRFRAQDTQSRQMMPVPRGNRIATVLQVTRSNFGGPLQFAADQLPPGITMHAVEMPSNIDRFPVVFEATPEAEPASALVDVKVTHHARNIRGRFGHTVEMVRGPGNRIFYRTGCRRPPSR